MMHASSRKKHRHKLCKVRRLKTDILLILLLLLLLCRTDKNQTSSAAAADQ
jgi:hypothetical protein